MNAAEQNCTGSLRVIVRSANGALPVADASVIVTEGGAESGAILYTLRTGEDGLTPLVALSAPPRENSLVPDHPTPCARYNIEVRRAGYGTVMNLGVPIFEGVTSTQPVLLVPIGEGGGGEILETPPTPPLT